jgi:hypothetical protein
MGLKNKQMELLEAMKTTADTESRVYTAEEKAKELKDQLQFNRN